MTVSTAAALAPLSVTFVADLVCPFCWVGWARLRAELEAERALSGREAVIKWWPFQLDPDAPAEGRDRRAWMAAKFPDAGALAASQARIVDMGRADGIEFRFDAIERSPNTSAAHRLVLWASDTTAYWAVVDAVFAAYFRDGRDIGDFGVLAEIAGAAGMDAGLVAERLAAGVDAEVVAGAYAAAVRGGVTGVPFYVFQEKVAVTGAQSRETLAGAMGQALAGD